MRSTCRYRVVYLILHPSSCLRDEISRRNRAWLLTRRASYYNVMGCISWNCILVPGVTVNVPAVCPYCAWRAVLVGLPGWTLFVFIVTLRPFTETDVSSSVSGSDLRGLARDDLIFPNAFVPAFNTTVSLTTTS